ncbi:membrane protein [Mycobacterium montefiorense]|nr:membrane protein [Mycobacterium montefiorense]GKU53697.1 membrane protein [Mycobacterium montefiorense]GKU63625.1 membrane protein [Mycobacterium montefiorense]GKU66583.1 membrane protein [Mycobacterium montefiorense]
MMASSDTDDPGGPPRALLIAAVAVAVVAIGIVLVIAATRQAPPQPVALPSVPAPQADSSACHALSAALPQRLGDYQRAALAQPAPQGATAWRAGTGSEPVVLRCGLDRPTGFVVGSAIQIVDRVQWFEVAAEQQSAGDAGRSTWYTVDRPVYLALTLPSGSGPTPIQQLSEVIDRIITAVPIDPARPGER